MLALEVWATVDMLRDGFRQQTALERFETRLQLRFLVLVVGGIAAIMVLHAGGYDGIAVLVLVPFLVIILLQANTFHSKTETAAQYKRRLGINDQGDNTYHQP